MKREEVPQDRAKAFLGHSKLLYAADRTGRYRPAPSSGWDAEEVVLEQALAEYERAAQAALERARAGTGSTLAYHMCRERMDLSLLAQATGYPRWRVRRHLRPGAFARLRPAVRARYADALGKDAAALERLPEAP